MRKYLLHKSVLSFIANAIAHRHRGDGPVTTTYAAKARLKSTKKAGNAKTQNSGPTAPASQSTTTTGALLRNIQRPSSISPILIRRLILASISTSTPAATGSRTIPFPPTSPVGSALTKCTNTIWWFCARYWKRAAQNDPGRNAVTQKIGDFYASCMDEAAANKAGATPLKPELGSHCRH